jgi:hypothetical protein
MFIHQREDARLLTRAARPLHLLGSACHMSFKLDTPEPNSTYAFLLSYYLARLYIVIYASAWTVLLST